MAIHVSITIAVDRFELGGFVGSQDGLEAELERVVPTGERAVPYVWVTGPLGSLEALTESLSDSDTTTGVTVLDELQTDAEDHRQYLYRIEWEMDDLDVLNGIVRADGAILAGESTGNYWSLRLRFSDHEDVATFYQYLADNEITDFSIESIYELDAREDREGTTALSHDQREALTLAAQEGYFEMPRQTDLQTLGEELDISQQAVSERVRRGVKEAVYETLDVPHSIHED